MKRLFLLISCAALFCSCTRARITKTVLDPATQQTIAVMEASYWRLLNQSVNGFHYKMPNDLGNISFDSQKANYDEMSKTLTDAVLKILSAKNPLSGIEVVQDE